MHHLAGCIPLQVRRQCELVRKTALVTTPAVLLGQLGWMPFSNYVIKLDETGAIVSLCVVCRTFAIVHSPAMVGFLAVSRWAISAEPRC